MKPYLFEWTLSGRWIRVPSFGFFLAAAFSVAYFWSLRNAKKLSIEPKHVERMFLLILISSIFGGRLFHIVFEEPSFYWMYPTKILAVWEGGFTLYGAMLGSFGAVWTYCRAQRLSFGNTLDMIATSTLLSISIGRVGCFLAGCCWGKACSLPWAVTFTDPEVFNTIRGVRVHPTQLYEALGAFAIFLFCQRLLFSRRFPGEVGLKAVIGYALLRFLVEWFRGDSYRGFILDGLLSYSQVISVLLLVAAFLTLRLAKDPS